MTATVITFAPKPQERPAPAFASVAEALTWYRAKGVHPGYEPPVDAIGEATGDAYLATVFAGLMHMATVGARIAHLHAKADEQDRHRAALDREGHLGSEAHARVRDVLRRWADEIHAAIPTTGGAA